MRYRQESLGVLSNRLAEMIILRLRSRVGAQSPQVGVNARLGLEPASKTSSGRAAIEPCDPVLEVLRDAEKSCISKACICHFADNFAGANFTNLQQSAAIGSRTHVDAHGDQPAVLLQIVMPIKGVLRVRNELIHAPLETADRTAPGNRFAQD